MTALKGRAIASFVEARDPEMNAVLIYGPDAGLVGERAAILARSVVDDLKDPFNYIELGDSDLKSDPARISDEAAALSFTGGERIVRIRKPGEASVKAIANFLTALDAGAIKPNAFVIVEAGELAPRSSLRKAFEKAKRACALPCYQDRPNDIRALAQRVAHDAGLGFEADALDLLCAALGEDRALSRSEIDKLVLYKGPVEKDDSGTKMISADDVRAAVTDSVGNAADAVVHACAIGAPDRLANALFRAASAGAAPISLLRALQRHFSRLHSVYGLITSGESEDGAMKKIRPPVFFAEQPAFRAELLKWRGAKLGAARRFLVEAEFQAKTTGAPQREIVERAALRLARMAQR